MTKSDAIDKVKQGYSVFHPTTGGSIEERTEYSMFGDERVLKFNGDCSPQTGWEAEWLGAR